MGIAARIPMTGALFRRRTWRRRRYNSLRAVSKGCKKGRWRKSELREVIETLRRGGAGQQDLLYLQADQTSVASQVIGFSLVEGGEVVEQHPGDPWPYETVLDAMQDGWRIVQFPNLALVPDENRPTGLGCEFILERWR